MLSQKAKHEFKEIYLKKFGEKLSDKEVNKKGMELLKFFRLIYKPIPKNYTESRKKGGEKTCL
ncbi:hypothetical protein ACFL0F_01975 [Patescibacteria group bacterium]